MPCSSATITRIVTAHPPRTSSPAGSRSPATPRLRAGPASRLPPSMVARSRMPTRPGPPPTARAPPATRTGATLAAGAWASLRISSTSRRGSTPAQPDVGTRSVTHHIAQRLLHDAYADRSTLSGNHGVPAAAHGDRYAAAVGRVEQGVQIGQPGLGGAFPPVGAQHAQLAAQLGQPGQRARSDLAEALHQLRRRIDGLRRGLGLDCYHRHVVGDHVGSPRAMRCRS